MFVLGIIALITYIMRYAEKVRKFPEKSLVYGRKLPSSAVGERAIPIEKMQTKTKILLSIFALTFAIMILGVSRMGWWFLEMTALFLVGAIVIALIQRTTEKQFIDNFLNGSRDLLGVAFIVGIARGVTFILNEGQISDTILFYATNLVEGMPPFLFLPTLIWRW